MTNSIFMNKNLFSKIILYVLNFFVLFALSIYGCQTLKKNQSVNIKIIKNDFDNSTIHRMEGNTLVYNDDSFKNDFFDTPSYREMDPLTDSWGIDNSRTYGSRLRRTDDLARNDKSFHIVELNAQRFQKKGEKKYSLIVEYSSTDFIYIEPGKSLELYIDGEKIVLSTDGSLNHRESDTDAVFLIERAWYDITPETFEKIAYGAEGKLKIIGRNFYEVFVFHEYNFKNFGKFYDKYVKINDK